MENSADINEEEIIKTGKEMIENGLGATFVFKWVRDRVAEDEMRGRIITQINAPGNSDAPDLNQDKIIANRKFRNSKYIYEDFLESIDKIKIVGIVNMVLGLLLLCSFLFLNGYSLPQSITSMVLGISILLLPKFLPFKEQSIVIVTAGIYLGIILLEYIVFGLPDSIIPGLGEFNDRKIVGAITILNDMSPIIYFGLRVVLVFLFIRILLLQKKVNELSRDMKKQLGIKD